MFKSRRPDFAEVAVAALPYLDRSRRHPGVAYEGGAPVRAFDRIGLGVGRPPDVRENYQHLSTSGPQACRFLLM